MGEILFRGKPKNLKAYEWVHGQLLYHQDNISKIYSVEIDHPVGVIPETVGQYTGIFTMDEVEGGDALCTFIYEGDIVEPVLIDGTHKGFSWGRQVVVFDRGAFCLKDRRGEITPMCNYAANVQFKVWGNIHDNPELLEVSE